MSEKKIAKCKIDDYKFEITYTDGSKFGGQMSRSWDLTSIDESLCYTIDDTIHTKHIHPKVEDQKRK